MKPRPNTWRNLATGEIAWRRVIFPKKYWLRRIYAVFSGWQFPMLPYRAVNIYIMFTSKQGMKGVARLNLCKKKKKIDEGPRNPYNSIYLKEKCLKWIALIVYSLFLFKIILNSFCKNFQVSCDVSCWRIPTGKPK